MRILGRDACSTANADPARADPLDPDVDDRHPRQRPGCLQPPRLQRRWSSCRFEYVTYRCLLCPDAYLDKNQPLTVKRRSRTAAAGEGASSRRWHEVEDMKNSSFLGFRRALVAGCCLSVVPLAAALPVFPGAVGYGTDTVAARNISDSSKIYRVTSLANSGTGTLREFVENRTGPRVIIFDVGGVINLTSDLAIRDGHGNLMIAGQTAPFPGITLKGCGMSIQSSDILIQHIGIRPGNGVMGTDGVDNRDCIKVEPQTGVTGQNVVIDHVSMSWAIDETASVWSGHGISSNVTFSNCIFSKPILNGGHSKGSHGYGVLVGRNASHVSLIKNLMAFCWARNPLVNDDTNGAQVVNNYIYSPGPGAQNAMYMQGGLAPYKNSLVGNVFVRKATPFTVDLRLGSETVISPHAYSTYTSSVFKIFRVPLGTSGADHNVIADASVYASDNTNLDRSTGIWGPPGGNQWHSSFVSDDTLTLGPAVTHLSSDPYANSGGTTWSPLPNGQVAATVLLSAGKMPAMRDDWDAALINEVATGTGEFVEYPADLGSDPWAVLASTSTRPPLALPSNPTGDDDGDGYKNFEEWLHDLAVNLEQSTSIAMDVSDTFEDGNLNGWTSEGSAPNWAVVTDGSNVLEQDDYSGESRALFDDTNWSGDQVVEARVKPTAFNGSNRFAAVYARYQGLQNTYYVTLRNAPSGGQTVQLRKIAGGTVTTFDSETTATFPIATNSWYQVRLVATGTSTVALTATVTDLTASGNPSVTLTGTDSSSPFATGRAAVGTYLAKARFDDIFVSPNASETGLVLDDFDDGNATGWSTSNGTWAVDSTTKTYRQTNTGTSVNARAYLGTTAGDQSVQATVCPLDFVSSSGSVLICARYTDLTHNYFLKLGANGNATLMKSNGGSSVIVDGPVAVGANEGQWYVLKLEAEGSALRGYINGELVLQATDTALTSGTAAVGTYGTTAAFDDVIMSGL